jgi:hypothetical protein
MPFSDARHVCAPNVESKKPRFSQTSGLRAAAAEGTLQVRGHHADATKVRQENNLAWETIP